MNKTTIKISVLAFLGFMTYGYAQQQQQDPHRGKVGVNTIEPSATMDIRPSTANAQKEATTNEGIIAPKLSKTRIANIATPVEGTLVYATDATYTAGSDATVNNRVAKITEKGYYFYNGTEWVKTSYTDTTGGSKWTNDAATGVVKLTNLSDGATPRTEDKNLFVDDQGNVSLGTKTDEGQLTIMPTTGYKGVSTHSGNTVIGTGTTFLTTYKVGQMIEIGTSLYRIVSIESDTSLTVDRNITLVPSVISRTIPAIVAVNIKNGMLHMETDGSSYGASIFMKSWNRSPAVIWNRWNGTPDAPTAVKQSDVMVQVQGRGFDGQSDSYVSTAMETRATQDWTSTGKGHSISFYNAPNDGVVPHHRMIIDQNGRVGIGNGGNSVSERMTPKEKLHVDGGHFRVSNRGYAQGMFESISETAGHSVAFIAERARGTSETTKQALVDGDNLFQFQVRPYNGTEYKVMSPFLSVIARGDYATGQGATNVRLAAPKETSGAGAFVHLDHSGNTGIGTTTPTEKLEVAGNIKSSSLASNAGNRHVYADANGVLKIGTTDVTTLASLWTEDVTNNSIKLAVNSDGSTRSNAVSILDDGKVHASSFMGTNGATIFPDYVFQKYYTGTSSIKADYNFKSLSQVEDFVKTNGHLPGYKSAETIKAQGYVDLMETQLTNVEKIEELYLHSIEQDKVNKQQAEALKAKDAEIADLKQRLERLEKLIQ